MTNEQYLIVSYFVCGTLSAVVGTLVYFFLRDSFGKALDAVSGKGFSTTLKRLFPCGVLLPAVLGFVSVSYRGCVRSTYEDIIRSREYLVERNQAQISSVLFAILIAVLFWDIALILVLKYAPKRADKPITGPNG